MSTALQSKSGPGGGGSKSAKTDSDRATLDQDEMLEKLKDDLCTLADRGMPALIGAVARTEGTEGAHISIKCGYKSGGAKSKSRIEVVGEVKIPIGGFSREVGLIEVDGEMQIRMFDD